MKRTTTHEIRRNMRGEIKRVAEMQACITEIQARLDVGKAEIEELRGCVSTLTQVVEKLERTSDDHAKRLRVL